MKIVAPSHLNLKSIANHKVYTYEDGLDDAEIIIGSPQQLIKTPQSLTALKYVHLLSAGYDKLNIDTLNDMGVIISNARGLYSKSIAEYVVLYILAHYHRYDHFKALQDESQWEQNFKGRVLDRKTVAILGTGSIGQEIAKRLRVFGVHVIGVNRSGNLVSDFDECMLIEDLKAQLSSVDCLVSALPASPESRHIINKDLLLKLNKDAILVNVGRGDAIHEAELIEILDTHLGHVVMDVFEKEPLDANSPLWLHPKVRLTPHSSIASEFIQEDTVKMVQENILYYLQGHGVKNQI